MDMNACVWCGEKLTEETKDIRWCDPCCSACADEAEEDFFKGAVCEIGNR